MAIENPNAKKKGSNLHKKYRLVLMDDGTFEEVGSYKLSRLNVYMLASSLLVLLVIAVTSLIIFTPLRYYIPGYGDYSMRSEINELANQVDDLKSEIDSRDAVLKSLGVVVGITKDETEADARARKNPNDSLRRVSDSIPSESSEVQAIREEVEARRSVGQLRGNNLGSVAASDLAHFQSPLTNNARMTSPYSPEKNHYGVDLADAKNTPVKAVLNGTVIMSTWSYDTGHMIGVQHSNNFISFYKHNSMLLKKVGSFVKAGEAVAIIGNSGEQSTGPHLHFELWHNGHSVNPQEYISF